MKRHALLSLTLATVLVTGCSAPTGPAPGQSSGSAPGSSGQSSGSAPGSSGQSSGSAPGSSGQLPETAPTAAAVPPDAAPAAMPAEACAAKGGAVLGEATPGCKAPVQAPPAAVEPAAAVPAGPVHVGGAFAIAAETPLAKALTTASAGETTVRVSGTIAKVCQKKGCWMVVRDGDLEARVIMKDYGFVVPIDSAGRRASVEGVLQVKEFTEAQAKHLAEDGNEDPNSVKGPTREYLLTATAIDIGG